MSGGDRLLVAALVVAFVLMAALVLVEGPSSSTVQADAALAGEPRDVDIDLLRRRILRGELSDEEAIYYHAEK